MRYALIVGVVVMSSALAASAGDLRVGAAEIVITPAMGTPLAGYYSARSADNVHDDIHAKALVFEQDGSKAAMVVCDLLTMPRSVVDEARGLIKTQTGISAERVMISATHTHTAPVLPVGSARDPDEGGDMSKARQYVQSLPQQLLGRIHSGRSF